MKTFNGHMFFIQYGSKIDSTLSRCARQFNLCLVERQKAISVDNYDYSEKKTDVLPILADYLVSTSELIKPIEWEKASECNSTNGSDLNLDKLIACSFGECGAGKSTWLSLLSDIYEKQYERASKGEKISFEHAQSIESVTTVVRIASAGNMTLIDSPGTNDPNKLRTDQRIQVELINLIRDLLKDSK